MATDTCESIKTRLEAPGTNFSKWKTDTKTVLDGAGLTAVQASDALKHITLTTSCIQNELNALSGTTRTASSIQSSILELQGKLQKEREFVRIAKDRARMAQDGQQQPSYYDAWFPLGRPMKAGSVLLFTGFALFMLLMALFLLLSFVGIDLRVMVRPLDLSFLPYWVRERFPVAFWIVLVAFIVALVFAVQRQ
jgi:hypothetical protein